MNNALVTIRVLFVSKMKVDLEQTVKTKLQDRN